MAAKMKALKSDSLAAILSWAKREAQFNRGVVRQHDWVCHDSGWNATLGARPMGVI
jgi:hypothetical protein